MAERLTNEQKLEIQRLVGEGKNAKKIAKALDKEETTIINYVGTVAHQLIRLYSNGVDVTGKQEVLDEAETPEVPIDTAVTAPAKSTKKNDYMVHKALGGRDGVTIMTETASSRTDETAKSARGGGRFTKDTIHKPHG